MQSPQTLVHYQKSDLSVVIDNYEKVFITPLCDNVWSSLFGIQSFLTNENLETTHHKT